MEKSKILVCCHKKAEVYSDDIYKPIHVGKALHPNLNLGFMTDNIGENISEKNDSFCELTAQYWAWKNLYCKYIGLCHYRRYFSKTFDENSLNEELANYDIILASPINVGKSIFSFWEESLVNEDIHIFYQYMIARFPHLKEEIDNFFINGVRFSPCNMFVCDKRLFDDFASWQFSILFDLEKIIKLSSYSRPRRIFGYLAEGLLPFYASLNHLKIKFYPLVDFPNGKIILNNESYGQIFRNKIRIYMASKNTYKMPDDIKVSLNNAGVFDKIKLLVEKYNVSDF